MTSPESDPNTPPAEPETSTTNQPGNPEHQNPLPDLKARLEIQRQIAEEKIEESLFPDVRHPKKRAYLIAYGQTGNKTRAAACAGVSPHTAYTPQWREDRPFQEALAQVQEAAADLMEAEAYRRAVEGVDEPVGWYKGVAGGTVRKYSDLLMIFLLKGLRPDKYRDRMDVRATHAAGINWDKLPDHVVARLAAGEYPVAVLASWYEEQQRGPLLPAVPIEGAVDAEILEDDGDGEGG